MAELVKKKEIPFEFFKCGTKKELFCTICFFIGFFSCLPVGAFPQYTTVFSIVLALTMVLCFFDETFFLYSALFMFMRYKMLIGGTPVYRIYSYLVVIRFILDLPKVKMRVTYLPALIVFVFHSMFALSRATSVRVGLNIAVDCIIIYIVLFYILSDDRLFRKYIMAFMLGGLTSGVYGWTNSDMAVDINVRGAGLQKVHRNFGSLGDPNFAGLYYSSCIYASLLLKSVPKWAKAVLVALFAAMILETVSLSAVLSVIAIGIIVLILKFKGKSVFIIAPALLSVAAAVVIALSVPQIRHIKAVSDLIIRVTEKLMYISSGRLDLLTTDRYPIWKTAMQIFLRKDLLGKLFGGTVITVSYIDTTVMSIACHQSLIQAILDFGIIGTMLIYIPLWFVIIYRIITHMKKNSGYEAEDIAIIRIIFALAFIIFGMTVDLFVDWAYLFFYFI